MDPSTKDAEKVPGVEFEGGKPGPDEIAAARTRGEAAVRTMAGADEEQLKAQQDGTGNLPIEDALDYLVGAFQDPEAALVTRALRINVGTPTKPRIIRWVVSSIPGPTVRKIREEAERRARATKGDSGAAAVFNANVAIVVAGTVEPDLREGAKRTGLADPADFVEASLESRQGLFDQLAGAILTISGYDEDDVNDEVEVKAAGN